jgi:hypothetical protein
LDLLDDLRLDHGGVTDDGHESIDDVELARLGEHRGRKENEEERRECTALDHCAS